MFGKIADAVSNTIKVTESIADKVADTVADHITKNPVADLVGDLVTLPGIVKPGLIDAIKPGLIDLLPIKPGFPFPKFPLPSFPFPSLPTCPVPLPKPATGDSAYQGMLDSIGGLSGEIADLKKQLENKNLTPEQRMELSFKMQEKMQERSQMISMLTNMMKTEHDSVKEITRNFAV